MISKLQHAFSEMLHKELIVFSIILHDDDDDDDDEEEEKEKSSFP